MRTRKPSGSGFACMHVKAWIVDGVVLLTGSCNMTHGGLDHNAEHLVKITNKTCLDKAKMDFEAEWSRSKPVTQNMMDVMQRTWDEGQRRKKEQASSSEWTAAEESESQEPSRSSSSSRIGDKSGSSRSSHVNRSLSEELTAVQEGSQHTQEPTKVNKPK